MRLLAAIGIVILLWAAGLLAFAGRVQTLADTAEPVLAADGIVALTGASEARINTAMDLLGQGKARRLLVSGVNREVRREELREVLPGSNRLYDCCVDLGFEAETTVGNAQEVAAWTRAKSFHSVIVVTSDYHMPRALLEIRGAAPGLTLTPYAVRTESLDENWWRSGKGLRIMALEYCKYLAVLGREGLASLFRGAAGDEAPAPSEAAPA
ncbi:YdcF family protein [Brevundimonas sp. 2R-24]|uniref:YdcF family protein n=1 Tax=Peiella sedimenti TaxID=3061083 RepID=A0ABT8SH61_9CAUL|nr:YdcF family protein [Caulobacteraceae bacterium XZ-24]